jgi:hypothetical protein
MCFYTPDLHFYEKNNKSYFSKINIKKQKDEFCQIFNQTIFNHIKINR